MKFTPTAIAGVMLVDIEPRSDDRGFFARTWCEAELSEHGLDAQLAQCSISYNARRGTLRGMHFQAAPHEESKLVRCTRGRIYDVALDLRPDSPTFRKWTAHELTAENRAGLFVPKGCAHGFQTLDDDVEVLYMISTPYVAAAARGVRWNDSAFGIDWPLEPILSDRDRMFGDFAG